MPTGLPLCTSNVSSFSNIFNEAMISSSAWKFLAALPLPPYTINSSGRSANFGIQIIQQHTQCCFLYPAFALQVSARWRFIFFHIIAGKSCVTHIYFFQDFDVFQNGQNRNDITLNTIINFINFVILIFLTPLFFLTREPAYGVLANLWIFPYNTFSKSSAAFFRPFSFQPFCNMKRVFKKSFVISYLVRHFAIASLNSFS